MFSQNLINVFQYDKIDNEHKILFQGIFNVAAGRGDAGALKNLIDNVEFHFNEEQVSHISSYKR